MFADQRRQRDRRNVEQRSFEGRRDRARVRDVVAQVRAEVDARDDDVGSMLLHQLQHGEIHAVGRRAVDDPFIFFELQEPQRPIEGQRV